MQKQRYYVSIDLKSFYASVECVERGLDPLTTNLVVADESRTEKTICLAVTPSLKKFGLSGRSRLFEVEQKAREIYERTGEKLEYLVAKPRMALYERYSADIYSIYLNYMSPEDIHVYSIDEVFMDVTAYLSLYQMGVRELVKVMLHDIFYQTGITATAGIGTNLYLCKVAMDIVAKHMPADKEGVRIAVLDEMSYRKQLWDHHPLTDFWRMGKGTMRQLERAGINTMGDIARVSVQDEERLYQMFGIDAELLIDHAWGYEPCTIADIKAYRPKTNSFSSGQVLKCPYPVDQAKIVLREMTELLVLDLVDKKKSASSLSLYVGYDRENISRGNYQGETRIDRYGRSVPKTARGTVNLGAPSSSSKKITDAVLGLFEKIVNPKLFVRRLVLNANHVVEDVGEQLDLFSDVNQLEKEKKMQNTMLGIRKRFGKNAILKGTDLQEGATVRERNEQIGGHKA